MVSGFSADGVTPMKRKSYSMWPVALCCLNLPAHVRMTLPALWVSCIVPPFGIKGQEADDFQPFTEVIVDDLNLQYMAGTNDVEDSTYRCISAQYLTDWSSIYVRAMPCTS